MARRVLQEDKVVVYTVIDDGGDQGGNLRSPLMDRSAAAASTTGCPMSCSALTGRRRTTPGRMTGAIV
jgi:hypothetical protein